MTNTALRAGNSNSRTITFKGKKHEKFYEEYLEKCRYQDVYHQALVYCLGIDRDTRENVNKIYNFKTGCVKTMQFYFSLTTTSLFQTSPPVAKSKKLSDFEQVLAILRLLYPIYCYLFWFFHSRGETP